MLKKFFSATILLLMMAANCSAMTLQTPAEIGSVSIAGDNGIKISGATNINATSGSEPGSCVKGTATFGELWLHFDGDRLNQLLTQSPDSDMMKIYNEVSFFGSSDVKNSVPFFVFEGLTKIYRLGNDAGLTMYLLSTETGDNGSDAVIGEHGGKWVKYFDTSDAKKNYGLRNFFKTDCRVAGNKIIFRYKAQQSDTYREIHYTWSEAAQWFAVDVK